MSPRKEPATPAPKRRRPAANRGPSAAEQLAEVSKGIASLLAQAKEAAGDRAQLLASVGDLEKAMWHGSPETPSVIVRLSLLEKAQEEHVLKALLVVLKAAARQPKLLALLLVPVLFLLAKGLGLDMASFKKMLELANQFSSATGPPPGIP